MPSSSDEVVIGGPHGDPSPFATANPPGGIVQPGWEKGLRHGYAQDGDFIFDEVGGQTLHFALPVPLDCKHIVVLYAYSDAQDGGISGRLLGALMKLEDGELIDTVRDVRLDIADTTSSSWGNFDACVLNFSEGVGHIALMHVGEFSDAENGDIRATVLKVDINGTEPVLQKLAQTPALMYSSYRGVYDTIRLTDSKFVCTYEWDEANLQAFNHKGVIGANFSIEVAVQVFELVNGQLTYGPKLIMDGRNAAPSICMVDESRIIIASLEDRRTVWRDRSHVAGTNSLYISGLIVRTADVDGLTLTENTSNAAVQADANIQTPYSSCHPSVKMLNEDTAVVVYSQSAQHVPTVHYRNNTTLEYSPGPAYSELTRWTTDGDLHIVSATGYPEECPETPAALRFSIGADGSVTKTHKPHILDASPSRWKPTDWWETGAGSGSVIYYPYTQGYETEVVDNYMVAAWHSADMGEAGANYNLNPYNRHHDTVFVATTIVLDDASPSGLVSNGIRHLGYKSFVADELNWMRIRNLPGTELFVGIPDPDAEPYVDGNIEGGVIPPGYPEDFWKSVSPSFGGMWDYYTYGRKNSFAQDYWDIENMADYEPKFGTYAYDAKLVAYEDGNHPRWNAYRTGTLRVTPYRIPPPRIVGSGEIRGIERKVLRYDR